MKPMPRHRQRLSQILIGILALGVWTLVLQHYVPGLLGQAHASSPRTRSASFDTLTVHRINVVGPDGKPRLILSDSTHFPGAIIHGKSYPRSISDMAGMIFINPQGDETGGLATATLRDNNVDTLTFDYNYQLTDGIRMWKEESRNGQFWRTAFAIFDRRPFTPGNYSSSQGVQRIALSDQNRNAELVISDSDGHARIRIGVGADGKPHIQMLDAHGKVVYDAVATVKNP